jgi:hypothetical protein
VQRSAQPCEQFPQLAVEKHRCRFFATLCSAPDCIFNHLTQVNLLCPVFVCPRLSTHSRVASSPTIHNGVETTVVVNVRSTPSIFPSGVIIGGLNRIKVEICRELSPGLRISNRIGVLAIN